MKEFWSGRIRSLTPYTPGEQPKERKFIKLNTNENPYPPSPKVVEAVQQGVDERLKLYPDPDASKLVSALAQVLRRQGEPGVRGQRFGRGAGLCLPGVL